MTKSDNEEESASLLPVDSGAADTQERESSSVAENAPKTGQFIPGTAQVIAALVGTRPRVFGGDVAAALTLHLSQQVEQYQIDLRAAQDAAAGLKADNAAIRQDLAVYRDRFKQEKRNQKPRAIAFALGVTLLNVGLDFLSRKDLSFGIGLGAAGAMCIWVSLLLLPGSDE